MYNKKTREVEVFKSTFNWWAAIFGPIYGFYKGNYLFASISFAFGCLLGFWTFLSIIVVSAHCTMQAQAGVIPQQMAFIWIRKFGLVINLVSMFFTLLFSGSIFSILHEITLKQRGFLNAGLYRDKWDAKKIAVMLLKAKLKGGIKGGK